MTNFIAKMRELAAAWINPPEPCAEDLYDALVANRYDEARRLAPIVWMPDHMADRVRECVAGGDYQYAICILDEMHHQNFRLKTLS